MPETVVGSIVMFRWSVGVLPKPIPCTNPVPALHEPQTFLVQRTLYLHSTNPAHPAFLCRIYTRPHFSPTVQTRPAPSASRRPAAAGAAASPPAWEIIHLLPILSDSLLLFWCVHMRVGWIGILISAAPFFGEPHLKCCRGAPKRHWHPTLRCGEMRSSLPGLHLKSI